MIKSLNSNSKKFNKELNKFLNLRIKNINLRNSKVFKIVDDVKKNGDKALIKYEKKFNANSKINISNLDIKKSIKKLDNKVRKSIDLAYNRIIKYHSNQKFNGFKTKDKLNNKFEYKFFPVEKVVSKNIDQKKGRRNLELLTIKPILDKNNFYEINLIFSGNGVISIKSKSIDVILDDQETYREVKNFPKHKI